MIFNRHSTLESRSSHTSKYYLTLLIVDIKIPLDNAQTHIKLEHRRFELNLELVWAVQIILQCYKCV